jgi:ureidoglycolate dehydrogenase (NAD+)
MQTGGGRVAARELERWVRAVLEAAGLEGDAAAVVAATLVETSLRGVDSHGVARLPSYVHQLRAGALNPRPRPAVIRREGALAVVDGDQGPGQVAAVFATDLSVELAREHGVGVALVRRSGHYGAAASYTRRAAAAGMVALSMTNTEPLVIPYGGSEPALGTNPISLAAPTAGGVFDLDLATSQVAINRIYNARDEGRAIPEGWGVDERGAPTTDPAQVRAGVPLGGYKGYALALMVEILTGVLAGAGIRDRVGALYGEPPRPLDTGHCFLALDPERTVGRTAFEATLATLLDGLRASPTGPGFDEVLAPGDPEARAHTERARTGIPVEPALWATLRALGDELGVPPLADS